MFQTDNTDGFNDVSTTDGSVLAAAQLAYDEYIDFIPGIKHEARFAEVHKAASQIDQQKGTYYKINFRIEYVPTENKIDCDTIVLEDLTKAIIVQNVECDCCLNWDITNPIILP